MAFQPSTLLMKSTKMPWTLSGGSLSLRSTIYLSTAAKISSWKPHFSPSQLTLRENTGLELKLMPDSEGKAFPRRPMTICLKPRKWALLPLQINSLLTLRSPHMSQLNTGGSFSCRKSSDLFWNSELVTWPNQECTRTGGSPLGCAPAGWPPSIKSIYYLIVKLHKTGGMS